MTIPSLQFRRVASRAFVGTVLGSLVGLGVVVAGLGLYLREHLREQILSRDADLIAAVATLPREAATGVPEFDLIDGVLAASELRGVVALTVADEAGAPVVAVPRELDALPLPAAALAHAEDGAFARFHRAMPLAALFSGAVPEGEATPLVEIVVPLSSDGTGERFYAQFWTDGEMVAREFATLDRSLVMQGLVAWAAATGAVLLVFAFSFSRLRKSSESLEARTRELEQMNRELELAARSAAVGSISAHLLHGLKSPLAGLRAYLRAHGDEQSREAAGRMQQLVQETLAVLRAETRESRGKVPLAVLVETVEAKLDPLMDPPERRVVVAEMPDLEVPRRQANLLRLVLENLCTNALEATAGPTVVRISANVEADILRIRVADQSGGIAAPIREQLFAAGISSKPGGSGLGLAISRQLMISMHGDLQLLESDARGACFEVSAPVDPMLQATNGGPPA